MKNFQNYIGLALIIIIIASGLFLLWQKDTLSNLNKKMSTGQEIELENYKKENQDLKDKITDLENKLNNSQKQADNKSNGEVAGAQTENNNEENSNLIDLNSASQSELEKLPGIGPSKAQLIIEYRNEHPFESIEELKNVKGIGDKTFEKLASLITI